jgi:hypothetical protein
MDNKFKEYIEEMKLCKPASLQTIATVENKLGVKFPRDYIELMMYSNGCEGNIGESYIQIWPIEEVIDANEACEVEKYTPGLILFGSDGGGEAFAFDMREDKIKYIMVPYMLEFDAVIEQGSSLLVFFERLYNGKIFDK